MTPRTCPVCLAHPTASGYTPHAPLCPNGVDALAWGDGHLTADDLRAQRATESRRA